MDRHDAILHVQQIREQLARAAAFRVYRGASVSVTGLLAFVAAWVQFRWELNAPVRFLALWLVVAAVCITIVSIEMFLRCRLSDSVLLRDATIVAARQFVPCVVAGALLTLAIYLHAQPALPLLPGLWSILFSLGIFASRPGLPRPINFAAAYYLLAGLFAIATVSNDSVFDVWPMPLCFGAGQLLTATVLYFSTARNYEST